MFASTRIVSVALVAGLLIAACGSSDDGASTNTAVSVTSATDTGPDTTPDTTDAKTEDTTASTDAATQDVAADTAAAQASLLTLAEFPEGWSETSADGDGMSEIEAALTECVGVEGLTSSPAQATTGNFSSPDGSLIVNESVNVQATEQDARMVIASLTNPDVLDCVAGAYTELGAAALTAGAIADGAVIGDITANRLAVGTAGDATQAIRVVIPVTSGDATTQLTVDTVVVRAGRSLASTAFEGRLEATPVETIDPIIAAAASRLPV